VVKITPITSVYLAVLQCRKTYSLQGVSEESFAEPYCLNLLPDVGCEICVVGLSILECNVVLNPQGAAYCQPDLLGGFWSSLTLAKTPVDFMIRL
jgi:hypothetical protein